MVPRLEASLDYNAICVGSRPRSPPLPLFNFIKHKRGGTVPPRKNCGGTIPPLHRGVPPFHKPPVFTRRDGPASAQTRPAFSQTTSFYKAGRSRLGTKRPAFSQTTSFDEAGRSRLGTNASRLSTNHQFLRGGTVPPRLTCTQAICKNSGGTIPPQPTCIQTPCKNCGGTIPPQPAYRDCFTS